MKKLMTLLSSALLISAPLIVVAQDAAGKRPRTAQRRPPFVLMDFTKMFTAGPLSHPQPPSTLPPAAKPGFPRTANLWGSWRFIPKGMEHASRIDLWLGANFTADQIRELRRLNPNCFVLTSINTVENNDVPDEYFLRDTTRRKIEACPRRVSAQPDQARGGAAPIALRIPADDRQRADGRRVLLRQLHDVAALADPRHQGFLHLHRGSHLRSSMPGLPECRIMVKKWSGARFRERSVAHQVLRRACALPITPSALVTSSAGCPLDPCCQPAC